MFGKNFKERNKIKIVKVVFLDSKCKLPKKYKSYNYLIRDNLVDCRNDEYYALYEITNDAGFNYRGSKVIFIAYKDLAPQEETVGYKQIVKLTLKGTTKFDSDKGIKNVQDEQIELISEGWKLTNQAFNDFTDNYGITNGFGDSTSAIRTSTANIISTTPLESNYQSLWTEFPTNNIEDKNKKENTKMFENLTKSLKCGRAQDVRMSIYGPAFKGEDSNWYSVDNDDVLTDVSDLLLDMDSCCYMMPVAKDKVKEGDFILHNGRWVKITYLDEESNLSALDIFKKEHIIPALTKSPFGFEFYTKLIPLLDFSNIQADANNPFGILPIILMTKNKNSKDILPLLMAMGTQGRFNFDMSNPMMMCLLMKDVDGDNLLPFMMMSQMNKTNN